ncbi:MAG: leucine--tRNA ligase [Candidatus Eisenbacteria bacterium]|uniref:Leucine--tRNA ligase n=1 Tax=Eiseniibacteriota bacterium TaxID=2212470 RepID=A0A938BQY3_UNCEI|nr:leucine--tRNA ligase [Candidatus Eisenbacteria bacterium]
MPFEPYDPARIEAKWQARWAAERTNEPDLVRAEHPFYCLMMFPYPSAEGLHVGNVYAFTGADIQGRYQRVRGHQVFEPMGFDAFGIHSENFAMRINTHPMKLIPRNVDNFRRQLRMMGLMLDWSHEVLTPDPDYYKWTQWIFLQLHKHGLAYRKKAPVNWCPGCHTVISNEQVIGGMCERHPGTAVEKKNLEQWFFRITAYAQRLLDNLDWIDWSEVTKTAQRNWIGRSEGAEVDFKLEGRDDTLRVYTTRPDTLYGATYMVMAPEHPLVAELASPAQREAVRAYCEAACRLKDADRVDAAREKTGVPLGANAINPATGRPIPIWISDYVLIEYGTGAIMAVPAHDQRDFEFASRFGLPIIQVIRPDDGVAAGANTREAAGDGTDDAAGAGTNAAAGASSAAGGDSFSPGDGASPQGGGSTSVAATTSLTEAYVGEGRMIHSGPYDGMPSLECLKEITRDLEARGLAKGTVQYRLRDWCISRQRYWGPPIPMIHCAKCGVVPVPEEQLPVRLPEIEDFRPDTPGGKPLQRHKPFHETTCPACGGPAHRDTDVSDNFLDSAWYFLRYPSARDAARPWDPALTRKWLPVDMYVGGNEHAVLHLMYTRFLCMAFKDMGLIDFEEPFRKFRAHGLLIKEGAKMSKTHGNVVNPDDHVARYGADTLRMYLVFLGPYSEGGDFRDSGIVGIRRFLDRIHRLYADVLGGAPGGSAAEARDGGAVPPGDGDGRAPRRGPLEKPTAIKLHQTIKKVGEDIESFSYNTAIAALMELLTEMRSAPALDDFSLEAFVKLLAPFAPHEAEELWEMLGRGGCVFDGGWPAYDPALTLLDEVEIAVQVLGKLRGTVRVARDAAQDAVRAAAVADEGVARHLEEKTIVKVIYVPNRLVNFVVRP